jgi:LacI family transcriptional regulator
MKNLTLEDVARMAGVSPATVSRIINDQVGTRSKARAQVLRVIEETGFQPHVAARSLASRRSNVIGLFFAAPANIVLTHPNLLNLAETLTQACHEADRVLSLFLTGSNMQEQELLVKIMRPGLIDGLIVRGVGGAQSNLLFERLSKFGMPYVSVGRPPNPRGISYVATDNMLAAYHAVTHLIGLGHRRLALIVGSAEATYSQDRIVGYRKALNERELPIDEKLIFKQPINTSWYDIDEILQQQPTAILLETRLAETILQSLHKLGLRVPEDIAVVGFDDLPLAQQTEPMLTTMRQPIAAISKQLVSILLDMLETGTRLPRQVVFEQELVIRQSCGALGNNT